jgi:polar amino acid transport system permease protein
MTPQLQQPQRVRPQAVKAVPVRHPGRWLGIAVIAVLVAMFVHLIVTNKNFEWGFVFNSIAPGQRGAMFIPPVLEGLRGTILLTVFSMLIGVVLGILLAIMRLSPNPILSWVGSRTSGSSARCHGSRALHPFGGTERGRRWPHAVRKADRRDLRIHDLSLKIFSVQRADRLRGRMSRSRCRGAHEESSNGHIVDRPRSAEAAAALGLALGHAAPGSCCRRLCG